jgi:N-acetylglutamate synthase-like GNAT family acetyltransferase
MPESDDLKIRVATVEDMDEIMSLAGSANEENGFLRANPAKMAAEIWPALNLDHGICAVIGKEGGIIEGVILMRIGSMWYSDGLVVEEKAIFIHPEYRSAKGGRARKLCEFSKRVADTLGIPLIIGVLSNSRTEAKVRLYERQFGKPSGAFFLYGAKTGLPPEAEH